MTLLHRSGIFSVYGEQGETEAARDVIAALQTHAPQVLRDLDVDYQDSVTIELFSSQEALDRDGMNPDMQGYYAYSGDHHIQMVSPRNPLPNLDLPYAQRVQIAVHEFVHLVNNAINPDLPTWLNEGVATYIGPHDVYTYVCQHSFPFEQVPALTDLEQTYGTVPAADLFAYSAVDFIASAYGLKTLNQLIRQPGAFEEILGTPRGEFEQQWHEYMKANYTSSR